MSLLTLIWMMEVPRLIGRLIHVEQLILSVLALSFLFLATIEEAPGRNQRKSIWRRILMLCGAVSALFLCVRFPLLAEQLFYHRDQAFLAGIVLVSALLEAIRWRLGWTLFVLLVSLLTYALFGDSLPGPFTARISTPDDLFSYLVVDENALLGTPTRIVVTMVAGFLLFGRVLDLAGGGRFFSDLAALVIGRSRGATAKTSVVSSGLFGSLSGSAVANVLSTGSITIGLMRRDGYSPESAAAIEAAASTGGQLLPPVMGVTAFIVADFLQVPYLDVAVAASVPALLFYLSLFIHAGARAPTRAVRTQGFPTATCRRILGGWWFGTIPLMLVTVLYIFPYAPQYAALSGIVVIIFLGSWRSYGGELITFKGVFRALVQTGSQIADLMIVCAAAGLVMGILSKTGLAFGLTFEALATTEHALLPLLLVTAIVCLVLGLGMPTSAVYVLLATMLAPPLVSLGIDAMAAHLFVLFFGVISMITPPVAIAAYAAAGVASASKNRTALLAVLFAWPAFVVPFLFVYSPELILNGTTAEILAVIAVSVTGVCLMTLSTTTLEAHSLNVTMVRAITGSAGLILLWPTLPLVIRCTLAAVVILIWLRSKKENRGDFRKSIP